MTKERKLAVEMWKIIRYSIKNNNRLTLSDIVEIKKEFCKKHNLKWSSQCWFCTYVQKPIVSKESRKGCSACPIRNFDNPLGSVFGCNEGSLYAMVLNHTNDCSTEERLEACDKIIKALEGK